MTRGASPPKARKVCGQCSEARDAPHDPSHLVHIATGEHMLFDIYGMAVCPTCGTRWRRVRNSITIVE